jgi:carbon-monoxide dehydrogenase large subunit
MRAFLTGEAKFVADLRVPGTLHVAYVRSPFASARITGVRTEAAKAAPGVVAVFAAGDLPIIPLWEIALVPERFAQPALADGAVRYVGERVVAIVADSLTAALDAVELVEVDYEPLVPVSDPLKAASVPEQVCLSWASDAPDARFNEAEASVNLRHSIPRLSVAPMEGHAVLAVPGDAGRLTMWVSTQVPSASQRQIARSLGLRPDQVRVVTPAVGGGFGGKAAGAVVDHMVAGAAALTLRRPVSFVEDRGANLLTMQGRGVHSLVELHSTISGELIGMRATITADAGAYPSVGAVEPGKTKMMVCGPYRMRVADVDAMAVVTNLPPVGAYRGPGRSEAAVMLERSLDVLAADLGVDPLAIRFRNVLQTDVFPYAAPTGVEYDSGNYPALLSCLAEVADYGRMRRLQTEHRDKGTRLLGVGLSLVVDSTAWFARVESAAVRMDLDGTLTVLAGSAPTGQRHDVLYREIVRSVLPVLAEEIRVIEGDTDAWSASEGTMGSRTAQTAGSAVLRATEALADELRDLAAEQLEANPIDVVFYEGRGFGVRGVPSSARPLSQIASKIDTPVERSCVHEQPGASYPAAAHLSLVEVDFETGRVTPVRHVAVTDCGRVLDPSSARGQVIGATTQGIAQALYEEAVFDVDGTPRNASFADYAVPSACEVPPIEAHFLETLSPRNPLGAKGVGEIGMVAAPAAVQNAVVDAVRDLGVRHLDMPCTPLKVWNAMRAPRSSREAESPGSGT